MPANQSVIHSYAREALTRRGVGPHDVAIALVKAPFASKFVNNKVLEFVGSSSPWVTKNTRCFSQRASDRICQSALVSGMVKNKVRDPLPIDSESLIN